MTIQFVLPTAPTVEVEEPLCSSDVPDLTVPGFHAEAANCLLKAAAVSWSDSQMFRSSMMFEHAAEQYYVAGAAYRSAAVEGVDAGNVEEALSYYVNAAAHFTAAGVALEAAQSASALSPTVGEKVRFGADCDVDDCLEPAKADADADASLVRPALN